MISRRITPAIACLALLGTLAGVALLSKESEQYYIADNKIVEFSPALSDKSVTHAGKRFQYLYDTYLEPNDMDAYVAVIPDKSYYLPDSKNRGAMDYDLLFSKVYQQMAYAIPIDIASALEGSDYYATDSHWRQECLEPLALTLSTQMSGDTALSVPSYVKTAAAEPFNGSYRDAGETAGLLQRKAFSSIPADTLYYLTNDILEQAVVYNYDTGKTTGVYDSSKLTGNNPYDFFLSGPTAILTIDNPSADSNRRLVVFRDSYGSSLIPLLVPYYQKILVIDIRYTMSDKLGESVNFKEFADADALYLYSTTVLNQSAILR